MLRDLNFKCNFIAFNSPIYCHFSCLLLTIAVTISVTRRLTSGWLISIATSCSSLSTTVPMDSLPSPPQWRIRRLHPSLTVYFSTSLRPFDASRNFRSPSTTTSRCARSPAGRGAPPGGLTGCAAVLPRHAGRRASPWRGRRRRRRERRGRRWRGRREGGQWGGPSVG